MIKLYPINTLKYTIFEDEASLKLLNKHDIFLIDSPDEADIFLSRDLKPHTIEALNTLQRADIKLKKTLIWTHEPRFCKTNQHILTSDYFPAFYIMNVYTKNVYFSNFTIYGNNIDQLLDPVLNVFFSKTPIVALASHVTEKKQNFILDGHNLDLGMKRQKLIYDGINCGIVDLYGKDWPPGLSISNSRGPGWHGTKLDILKNYQFNIAIENTSYDYYCTEKLWDSIKGYCLPIYSSYFNKIYESFPRNSFLDFDEFESNDDLFNFIRKMSKGEYIKRLNLCIETYNHIYKTTDFAKEKSRAIFAIIDKIRMIYNEPVAILDSY